MKQWIALGIISLSLSSNAVAASATVSLSEESALLKYSLSVGGQAFGRTEAGVGVVFNSNKGYLFDFDLHVVDEVGGKLPGMRVGVGGKFYGGLKDNHEVMALGVGGLVRYNVPGAVRLFFGAEGYYAPSIVTFLESKRFWEWGGLVGYEILPQASVYVEYREFVSAPKDTAGNVEVDAGPRFGVTITF